MWTAGGGCSAFSRVQKFAVTARRCGRCAPLLWAVFPLTHMYTIIMTVSVPRVGGRAKRTLIVALSQNIMPTRFREELNVMANHQVLHSHSAVPKQSCNKLSKDARLSFAHVDSWWWLQCLQQGTKVCRHGKTVWAVLPLTHMYTIIMTVSVPPHLKRASDGPEVRSAAVDRW